MIFLHYCLNLAFADQAVTDLDTLKFLGLHGDNHLMWKFHLVFLLCILGTACFVIRRLSLVDAFKIAYYSLVYSLIKNGIIFWPVPATAWSKA